MNFMKWRTKKYLLLRDRLFSEVFDNISIDIYVV